MSEALTKKTVISEFSDNKHEEIIWYKQSFLVTIICIVTIYIVLPTLVFLSNKGSVNNSNVSEAAIIQSLIISQLPIIVALIITSFSSSAKLSFNEKFMLKNWRWKFIVLPLGIELWLLPVTALTTISIQFISQKLFNTHLPEQHIQELLKNSNNQTVIIIAISAIIIAPILEEIMFRKIIFDFTKNKTNQLAATIITSSLFAIMHATILITPALFILAIILQNLYIKYNSIYPCILLHMVHNLIAFSILIYFIKFWQTSQFV